MRLRSWEEVEKGEQQWIQEDRITLRVQVGATLE